MDIAKLNISQICSLRSHIKRENSDYDYRKKRRFLFWVWEEGFYYTPVLSRPYLVSKEFIEYEYGDRLYCEGEKVYYKPFISIRMSNDQYFEIPFDSEDKLNEFMSSPEMMSVNWTNRQL